MLDSVSKVVRRGSMDLNSTMNCPMVAPQKLSYKVKRGVGMNMCKGGY